MPEIKIIHSTVAFCTRCRKPTLATVYSENDAVYLKALCVHRLNSPVKIASDEAWYMARYTRPHRISRPPVSKKPVAGCPHDCGLCSIHTNSVNLPVFSITNDCNLDCPICFTYNRPDRKYYMSIDEIKRVLAHLRKHRERLDIINLTGGEPTLHPDLFAIIEYLQSCDIGRITINTNGITAAGDEALCRRIKASGVQMVLSLNTFDPEKSRTIHGKDLSVQKKKALEHFEKYQVPTTLLCVAVKDCNEEDLSDIVSTYIRKSFVKNFVIQNMTFTGANGKRFLPRKHITLDEVEKLLEKSGTFSRHDFFPLGSSHPLCYSAAYYFVHGDGITSMTKLIGQERLVQMSEKGYLLSPDQEFSRDFLDGINRLWAGGESDDTIRQLRAFFKNIYPADTVLSNAERSAKAEEMIKSVYIHSHMDEDTFDLERVSHCGDIVPDESGAMVPACSYNLLYRENDERFWHQ